MEDNKDKELDGKLPDNEKNVTGENSEPDLKEEMEELAKTFQEELNKAKAQAKEVAQTEPVEPEILIQDLEDLPEINNNAFQDEKSLPPEELCECCGEKRRGTKDNPDSEFCIDCDRGLRHYPFNFLNIILALIIIGFSFFACYTFADYTPVYVAAEKADSLAEQGKLYSAYTAYTEAAQTMVSANINGEMVYKRSLDTTMKIGGISYVSQLSTQFKPLELKLPHMRSVYNAFELVQEMNAAKNDAYYLIYQYEAEKPSDIPYDELMAKLNSLSDIAPSENPNSYNSTSSTTTTVPYNITATKYSKQMILFVKFYLSAICERDFNEQIGYLEEIMNETPEYTWLYASMLGDLYTKTGRDVTELCKTMRSVNAEDSGADLIEAMALRNTGKYDECIAICQKLISANDDYSYEFYRQIALCYLAQGKYTDAYNNANLAYQTYSTSIQVCNTLALCSAATGKEDTYKEIEKLFSDNEMNLSDEVVGFKNGTVSIEDIVLKGDFDV